MTKKDQVEIEEVVLDKTPAEKIDTSSLIVVKQIPIIEERLQEIKGAIQSEVDNALSFECTEENKQEIKKLRTNLSKQYKLLETDRKKIKDIVLGPYNAFEATYKECVTNIFKPADIQLKNKIDAVEATQKKAKKSKAVEFFNEYAAAHGIDFITFDDVGVEVTLSISDKKLKETCKTFIYRVVGDLALINTQDDQADILVEYKKSLDVSKAITSVKIRKKAIEEEAKRLQKEFMPEDTNAGIIQAFLDDYDDDYVCTRILFDEALHRTGEMKQWEGKEIANIMNNAIEGWKPHGTHRFGKEYGIQRSWKRMEDSVKKDKDGFIEVPEQLEIPFE